MVVFSFLIGAQTEVNDLVIGCTLGGANSLRVWDCCGFAPARAARKIKESSIVLEFTLVLQLVERWVPRLYRVEEGFPTVIITFRLCELDLLI